MSLALVLTTGSATAAPDKTLKTIPLFAMVEKITFDNVGIVDQTLILGLIDTRPGDFLTSERIALIPARLRAFATPHTFTYKSGSKPGQVVLSISSGC